MYCVSPFSLSLFVFFPKFCLNYSKYTSYLFILTGRVRQKQSAAATKKQYVVHRTESNIVRDNHRIRNMVKENPLLSNPQIKHVTNIQRDIHVKYYGVNKTHPGGGPGYFESSYKVIQIPKQHPEFQTAPKLQAVSRSKSTREVNSRELSQRTSTPGCDSYGIRLSSEFSKPMADDESDNLSDQQKDILNDLDDTLNKYQPDDGDNNDPKIIADVLPYGEFEPFNMDTIFMSDSGVDSDGPSSRTSSISDKSTSSRTGIISKRLSTGSGNRKVNSVSFKLPVGHKDKPYCPMQTSQKPKHSPPPMQEMGKPSGYFMSVEEANNWHANEASRRNSTGPFKGSFMHLFYKKYGDNNVGSYGNHARYLTPNIMDKVESFENLAPSDIVRTNQYRGNAGPSLTRRHTFR